MKRNHQIFWIKKGQGPYMDLRRANLWGANLSGADLSGANLWEANLSGADLPPPTMLLLASWGTVSGKVCRYLMQFDAANHPQPTLFDHWANGGDCPYNDIHWERCANFTEVKKLWRSGPAKHALELVTMLFEEKGITR